MASDEHQALLKAGVDKELALYRYPSVGSQGLRTLSFQDTCAFRGVMGGVMGGALGAALALLMSSMNPPGMGGGAGMGMPNPMNPVMASGPARPAAVVAVRPPAGAAAALIGPHALPVAPVMPVTPMDPIYGGQSPLETTSWQQVKTMARDTGRQARGNFKTWGIMSGSFALSECAIEKARGTSDELNPIMAGCATGAFLAARSGPQGMAIGCAGFATFSYAMEKIMHSM